MTSAQGLAARYRYDPYGRLLSSSGPLAGANLYRFAGKEVNPNYPDAGGYYSFGYRFYDPNLQRWLHRDPLGEAGGINLYGFVGNDPMNFIDPFGWDIVFVPPDWQGPPAAGDTIVPCPEAPPEVSLQENMTMAESHGFDSVDTWGDPMGEELSCGDVGSSPMVSQSGEGGKSLGL